MKRRNLLRNITTGTAGSVVFGQTINPQPSLAQPPRQWRMATSWPQLQSLSFRAIETFCERVKIMTDGQFIITPYVAGKIASALKVFDTVDSGEVECGHTIGAYYLDKQPNLVFAMSLPFGLTPYQQYSWFYYGGGLERMQQLRHDFNIVSFPAGSSGVQMGGWFNREVNTVNDLKGLKMRIPGFGAKVMKRLGVEPLSLSGDKIYAALANGTVDAAEWQNPYEDEQLRLYEVAKYYYYPGWWEPGTTYELIINRQKWEQLPKVYQQILQSAAAEANLTTLATFDAANGISLQRLVAHGVKLRPYSPEILQAAYTATIELLEATANQDATFKKLFQQWQQFRQQIVRWNQVNELSLESFLLQS